MKNRLYAMILPMTLAITLTLTACSADNKTIEANNAQNTGTNNSQYGDNNEGTQVEEDGTDPVPSAADVVSEVKKLLVMKGAIIPSSFPIGDGYHLTAAIEKNEADSYQVVFYQTKEATPVNDKSLKSDSEAKVIATFKAGTNEDPHSADIFFPIDTEAGGATVDLGHGIKASGEGAAGHSYLSWREGNWILYIDSPSEDQMDNQGIAKKMVTYLEDHYLPAPKDQGRVKVKYLPGGKDVHVGIYWQDGKVIYELETDEVPIDAMAMIVE
jgi:hypothetical protein